MKRSSNYQNKHLTHEVFIEPTTVAHHKYVMRCADCKGKFIKWVKKAEAEFLRRKGIDIKK
jgi:hypothetical protein